MPVVHPPRPATAGASSTRNGAAVTSCMPGAEREPVAVVVARGSSSRAAAGALASRLGLPLAGAAGQGSDVIEVLVGDGLALRLAGGPEVSARVDLLASPRSGGADPLFKAVLSGASAVIDATAGLGADSFHLAARGVHVTMIERSALVASLLADALERAVGGEFGPRAQEAAGLMTLHHGDARAVLPGLSAGVVLLDPMFPEGDKSSSPKKGMKLFRALQPPAPDDDEEHAELLAIARRSATRRVVVKRPVRAAPLAGVAPSGSLVGRTVRFDLYAPVETARTEGRVRGEQP